MRWSNVLVVEDDEEYRDIYRPYIERQKARAAFAENLGEAKALIKRLAFSVAFIDISLSPTDNENRDGLTVLQYLDDAGDETRAMVITGRGSFDIARESLQKHKVFRLLKKSEIGPVLIEAMTREALEDYAAGAMKKTHNYSQVLRPAGIPVWEWESRVLNACDPKGGTSGLYLFFEKFFRPLVPMFPLSSHVAVSIDAGHAIGEGVFWTRSAGQPVVVVFGKPAGVQAVIGAYKTSGVPGSLFGASAERLRLGDVLVRDSSHGITGVACAVENLGFDEFEA